MSFHRAPILADRLRRVDGSFAFLPHRFLREGFLASLAPDELRLYVFLVLAADRSGMSFYHYDRICSALEITPDDYIEARNGLIARDLLAFDGTRFQVLSLPEKPVFRTAQPLATSAQLDAHDPATVRRTILASLSEAGTPRK